MINKERIEQEGPGAISRIKMEKVKVYRSKSKLKGRNLNSWRMNVITSLGDDGPLPFCGTQSTVVSSSLLGRVFLGSHSGCKLHFTPLLISALS